MANIKSQRGQALVIIALAAVVLFGFAALAIDTSRVYADKRHAQNAADTSALAAALAKIRKQDYKAIALSRAADNGYTNDSDSTVEVNLCSEVACQALPVGADPNEYIRVRITSVVPMTLGRIVGWTSMTNDVDAIARAKGTPNTPNPIFGAGLVAVRNDNSPYCFTVNGGGLLTLHDTGIFVNCTNDRALMFNGSADISMDANAQVVGCANDTSWPIGAGSIECGVPPQTVDQNTFASYPRTEPTPSCTRPGAVGPIMTPGYFNGDVTIPPNTTFPQGTYCFNAGLYLGNRTYQLSGTGAVQWVLSSRSASATVMGAATFENLEIYANNASFTVQNTATMTADRFRFFGNGDSTFNIQGGTFTSSDCYIYSQLGTIEIDAQADVNLHAPPEGDTFQGLLMYMPWENPNNFDLNGGVNNVWTGLILMPSATVTYNGGENFELHGQVIAYDFIINGSGDSDIYFESSALPPQDNYGQIYQTK